MELRTLCHLPPTQNLISCKWLLRIKIHPNGFIDRFNVRLVAKGFYQRPGIDFHETVRLIKLITVQVILFGTLIWLACKGN